MAQMRIAGEIIEIPTRFLLLRLSVDVLPLRRLLLTLKHPIKLRLNPDHVLFELGLACHKFRTGNVIASQAEFNAVEPGINM